jgi:hypothetical protein
MAPEWWAEAPPARSRTPAAAAVAIRSFIQHSSRDILDLAASIAAAAGVSMAGDFVLTRPAE